MTINTLQRQNIDFVLKDYFEEFQEANPAIGLSALNSIQDDAEWARVESLIDGGLLNATRLLRDVIRVENVTAPGALSLNRDNRPGFDESITTTDVRVYVKERIADHIIWAQIRSNAYDRIQILEHDKEALELHVDQLTAEGLTKDEAIRNLDAQIVEVKTTSDQRIATLQAERDTRIAAREAEMQVVIRDINMPNIDEMPENMQILYRRNVDLQMTLNAFMRQGQLMMRRFNDMEVKIDGLTVENIALREQSEANRLAAEENAKIAKAAEAQAEIDRAETARAVETARVAQETADKNKAKTKALKSSYVSLNSSFSSYKSSTEATIKRAETYATGLEKKINVIGAELAGQKTTNRLLEAKVAKHEQYLLSEGIRDVLAIGAGVGVGVATTAVTLNPVIGVAAGGATTAAAKKGLNWATRVQQPIPGQKQLKGF